MGILKKFVQTKKKAPCVGKYVYSLDQGNTWISYKQLNVIKNTLFGVQS